jgi:hypothetical protein
LMAPVLLVAVIVLAMLCLRQAPLRQAPLRQAPLRQAPLRQPRCLLWSLPLPQLVLRLELRLVLLPERRPSFRADRHTRASCENRS